jgi:hypothetical protein
MTLLRIGLSILFFTAPAMWASISELPVAKPLYRDQIYDGTADPVVVYSSNKDSWYMFYTNRRANVEGLDGVTWVHGTPIGIAESKDHGHSWSYLQDADIDLTDITDKKGLTYWAPEVYVKSSGDYYMFLTLVPGVFKDWNHPRSIVQLESDDLLHWRHAKTLTLASDRVIDACVLEVKEGLWRMWYNNERDHKSIYFANSTDLSNWTPMGKAVGDQGGEGPKAFHWNEYFWMIVDVWDGLGVYRSEDALNWERIPGNLLQKPGKGFDDQVIGGHPDVVISNDRAYLFYFTHPGRTPENKGKDCYETRRSSIQVVKLFYKEGTLSCDRDQPTYLDLK